MKVFGAWILQDSNFAAIQCVANKRQSTGYLEPAWDGIGY